MAARDGMTTLITTLRGWCDAGTAEYTLAGESYWSDDHLQDTLDQHRMDYRRISMVPEAEYDDGGTAHYYSYYFPGGYWEGTASGTPAFELENSVGSAITTGFSVDLLAGHIRFTADQGGTIYYLSGRKFDVYRAAGQVWRQKAAHVASKFDVNSDNHRLSRSQVMRHYLSMAEHYEKQAPARSVTWERGDTW